MTFQNLSKAENRRVERLLSAESKPILESEESAIRLSKKEKKVVVEVGRKWRCGQKEELEE